MIPSGETAPNNAVWKQNTLMLNSLQAQTLLAEEDGNERAIICERSCGLRSTVRPSNAFLRACPIGGGVARMPSLVSAFSS
jgi:hypothetical protein